MILINGRGQIGEALKRYDSRIGDMYIYHTWDFVNKGFEAQKSCYDKLRKFVDSHNKCKIAFISTKCQDRNYYTKYKLLAENYIEKNCFDYLIIRLPNIVGKGVCDVLKKRESIPYGDIEFDLIRRSTKKIIHILKDFEENIINNTVLNIGGETITAELTKELLRYGQKQIS